QFYVGSAEQIPSMQVYDRSGRFLRTLPFGDRISALAGGTPAEVAVSGMVDESFMTNDNLSKAVETGLISGRNRAYRATGEIGDGFTWYNDVDMFRISLNAGDRLTVDVTGGDLGWGGYGLRLFDSFGSDLDFRIGDFGEFIDFTAQFSGVYYVGISGAENYTYNPLVEGSGSFNFYTGTYEIEFLVNSVLQPRGSYVGGELTEYGGNLMFVGSTSGSGQELWRYGGSGNPTPLDVNPIGRSNPHSLVVLNGHLYFAAEFGQPGDFGGNGDFDSELARYSGFGRPQKIDLNFNANRSTFPQELTALPSRNMLMFVAQDSSGTYQLWSLDQFNNRTIIPTSTYADPRNLIAFGDYVYFTAFDDAFDYELWRTDGVTAERFADLNTVNSSSPDNFFVHDGVLYFTAQDSTAGRELFHYDGVHAPGLVADLNPTGSSNPSGFGVLNGELYFTITPNAPADFTRRMARISLDTPPAYKVVPENNQIVGAPGSSMRVDFANARVVDAGPDHVANEADVVSVAGTLREPPGGGGLYFSQWTIVNSQGATVSGVGAPTGWQPLTFTGTDPFGVATAAVGFNLSVPDDDSFTVTLELFDAFNARRYSDVSKIVIRPVAPLFTLGPPGVSTETFRFTRQVSFTDPGTDAWTATVNYGDGSGNQLLLLDPLSKSFELNHVYRDDGVYQITVEIRDTDDDLSFTDTLTVTVAAMGPQIALNAVGHTGGLALIGDELFLFTDSGEIEVFNRQGLRVRTLIPSFTPLALGGEGAAGRLFVLDGDAQEIVEFHPTTGTEVNRVTAPAQLTSGDAITFDGTRLHLLSATSNTHYELNPTTGTVFTQHALAGGLGPFGGAAVVSGRLYYQSGAGELIEFDLSAGVITAALDIAAQNTGVTLLPGLTAVAGPDGLLAVTSALTIVEIDPATGQIILSTPFVDAPT
ncbi:MAG: pre-peptidase C-terminal domain-containing protein, partial [Planctomycetaceae bacterium]|nr:pre-peptidase C-terminal domain-containing protein [Planctomycetaceae bacterium]